MVPLYHQVADSLRRRIAAGEWAASGHLPSVVDLGHDYSIGEGTIRRAMNVLIGSGLVEQSKGRRARILPQAGEREIVLLPPGADVWVDPASAQERREWQLARGAQMVRVHHKAVTRSWPSDRVRLRVAWNHAGPSTN